MKTMGFWTLSVVLSTAAHGGISDALGASGQPPPQTPVSQSSAAVPASPDRPARETEFHHLGYFVESFTGSVIQSFADYFIFSMTAHEHKLGVPTADD